MTQCCPSGGKVRDGGCPPKLQEHQLWQWLISGAPTTWAYQAAYGAHKGEIHYIVGGRSPEGSLVVFIGGLMLRAWLHVLGHIGHRSVFGSLDMSKEVLQVCLPRNSAGAMDLKVRVLWGQW